MKLTDSILEKAIANSRKPNESAHSSFARASHVNLGMAKLSQLSPLLSLCSSLSSLYLYSNALSDSTLSHLHAIPSLAYLYLQDNRLTSTRVLGALKGLRCLDVSRNHVARIEGLEACVRLETLRAESQTEVHSVELDADTARGLSNSLKELSLAGNELKNPETLHHLADLLTLDLSGTNTGDWNVLTTLLPHLVSLAHLRLTDTPLRTTTPLHAYRARTVLAAGPKLATLDDKPVLAVERAVWTRMRRREERERERAKEAAAAHRAPGGTGGSGDGEGSGDGDHTDGSPDRRPIPDPHLPPYASQYRDMILHKMASSSGAPGPEINPGLGLATAGTRTRPPGARQSRVPPHAHAHAHAHDAPSHQEPGPGLLLVAHPAAAAAASDVCPAFKTSHAMKSGRRK
ncbi:hypothetical protein HDU93_009443 [Gonapodya sp. JEL0774]|nr:hypothetical protein HDU93_009443 [Gonapodya sp. JEL0774]